MRAVFLIISLACGHSLFSQGYLKGDALFTIGLGAPHLKKSLVQYNTSTDDFRKGAKGNLKVSVSGTNPIAVKYEYAFGKNFGLGLSLAWWTINVTLKDYYDIRSGNFVSAQVDAYRYKFSSVSFGLRPNYHFTLKNKKGDLFVGCALGVTKNSVSFSYSSSYGNSLYRNAYYEGSSPLSLYLAPTIGYRQYLTNNFGLNAEVGFEKGALLQAGLVFRFRPFKYERPA